MKCKITTITTVRLDLTEFEAEILLTTMQNHRPLAIELTDAERSKVVTRFINVLTTNLKGEN